jgi:uncharacterized protein
MNKMPTLTEICENYPIVALHVFGSRAKEIFAVETGQSTDPGGSVSDVDVGLQLEQGASLSARRKVELSRRLEDHWNVQRVDLVVLQEAEPFLALDVIKGELLYCRDPLAQAEFELYVLRRAGDLAPFEYERRRSVLEASR